MRRCRSAVKNWLRSGPTERVESEGNLRGAERGRSWVSICTGLLWLVVTASSRTGSKNGFKIGSRPAGKAALMKLGLQLGYWGAQPPNNHAELVAAAENAGFDAVFTAEAWGSDAYTPLAWWGSSTRRLRLGTSVVQLSARTPTACAMAALTLDHLSGGRHILGLGVSGPQVVEGWYGQAFPKPLARTREYVDIIRQVWARERRGPTGGREKPPKPITHPLRSDIPIMLGAEGPKNVALAAEVCDGWLPIFYTPRMAAPYNEWLG